MKDTEAFNALERLFLAAEEASAILKKRKKELSIDDEHGEVYLDLASRIQYDCDDIYDCYEVLCKELNKEPVFVCI